MADVEQMKKIFLFVTCEITFGRNVCELMSGVNVPDLNLGIHIFCQTTKRKQLCGFWIHVSLWDFIVLNETQSTLLNSRLLCLLGSSVWFWVCVFHVVSRDEFPRA